MRLERTRAALLGWLLAVGGNCFSLAAQTNQLDSDIRLFTVLTAINLAGYDDGLGSPSDSPVRQAVRDDLKDFQGSSLLLLKNFYAQNKSSDAGQNLSQYVSFALISEGPPTFELKAELPTDLPPDVRRLRAFSSILGEFYQQAPIEKLWSKYQSAFEAEIGRYQESLIQALYEAGGYLRVSPSSRQVQSFQVLFDLLGAANNINTRGYEGKVYVVVHPSKEPRVEEIRSAFLIHVLDPLAVRYAEDIAKKDVLSRFAMFAPALHEVYKTNFQLLVSKCLVRAVEARLSHAPLAKREAQVEQDLREGLILTPYFYESLAAYEKQGQDLRRYYPELIKGIDLKAEAARLQDVKFAEAPAQPAAPVQLVAPQVSEAELLLREAEMLFRSEKVDEARKKFEEALAKGGGRNADASYGLARVAISQGDADLGRVLFNQALESEPDPYVRAMSHVYVARISDVMGLRDQAIEHYQLVLAVQGMPDRARDLAQKGLDEAFASPRQQQQLEEPEAETGDLEDHNEDLKEDEDDDEDENDVPDGVQAKP